MHMNFRIERKPQCFVVHCDSNLDAAGYREMTQMLDEGATRKSLAGATALVLDLHSKAKLDAQQLSELETYALREGIPQHKIFLMNVPDADAKTLSAKLGQGAVHLAKSMDDVLGTIRVPAIEAHRAFVDAISDSVKESFKIQCPLMNCKAHVAFLKQGTANIPAELGSMVDFKTPKVNGTITYGFPATAFLGILNIIHGEKYATITPDIEDACGEMLNMLRSSLRKRTPPGYAISRDVPAVVKGVVLEKLLRGYERIIVVPFECDYGEFTCQIGISGTFKE